MVQNPINQNPEEIEDIFAGPGEPKREVAKPVPPPTPALKPEKIETEVKEKKAFPWKIILIILAILVIVLGIGAGGFFYYQKVYLPNKDSDTSNESTVNLPIVPIEGDETNSAIIVPTEVPVDSDYDGLSDEEEKEYNTDPEKADSDDDGLTDREEVKVYLTDPNDPDTDNDSYSDGEEVKNFFNPNGKGKLYNLEEEINKLNE